MIPPTTYVQNPTAEGVLAQLRAQGRVVFHENGLDRISAYTIQRRHAPESGHSQDVYDLIPWGSSNPSGYVVDYPDFDPERCVLHEIIAQSLYFGRKVVAS